MLTLSPRAEALRKDLLDFMHEHVYPNEARHWTEIQAAAPFGHAPVTNELTASAKAVGCGTCSCRTSAGARA